MASVQTDMKVTVPTAEQREVIIDGICLLRRVLTGEEIPREEAAQMTDDVIKFIVRVGALDD